MDDLNAKQTQAVENHLEWLGEPSSRVADCDLCDNGEVWLGLCFVCQLDD